MRSNIENKNDYNAIASKFNVMAGEKEKWGASVASHALTACKAMDIIRDDDIQKVEEVCTYEHKCTVIITYFNVVVIKHAYGECNHTCVTVGGHTFVISDCDSFAVFG